MGTNGDRSVVVAAAAVFLKFCQLWMDEMMMRDHQPGGMGHRLIAAAVVMLLASFV